MSALVSDFVKCRHLRSAIWVFSARSSTAGGKCLMALEGIYGQEAN